MKSKPSCTRKTHNKLLCDHKPQALNSLSPSAKDELLVQRVDFELSSLGSPDAADKGFAFGVRLGSF